MKLHKPIRKLAVLLFLAASYIHAGAVSVTENPDQIRFEQYTGATGSIVFWRLPVPGASTFPGSTCKSLILPSDKAEHASRFMALYLFAKTSGKQIFYFFDDVKCTIVSFGMDG